MRYTPAMLALTSLPPLVLVMAGGACGAALRYAAGRWTTAHLPAGLPWATWGVNIVGGLLMGALAGWLARADSAVQPFNLLLGVGLLGGFTTFSAFSLELYLMIVRGDALLALAYAIASVAGSVLALTAGVALVRA